MDQIHAYLINCDFEYSKFEYNKNTSTLSAYYPILGSTIRVNITHNDFGYSSYVDAINPESQKWLTENLHNFLPYTLKEGKPAFFFSRNASFKDSIDRISLMNSFISDIRKTEESADFSATNSIPHYWYSNTLNFGDWLGPYITQKMTGRMPIHSSRIRPRAEIFYSVGSILGWINRSDIIVWGSGLMRPFTSDEISTKSKLKSVKIYAVRGRKTQEEIANSLGWDVPDIYGDPGLLMPRFFTPSNVNVNDVGVVPHWVHNKFFKDSPATLIDVREHLESVITNICASKYILSSSLHGLILAQAYGIPWVWLDVTDSPLAGGHFKFFDFFSTLDTNDIPRIQVTLADLPTLDLSLVPTIARLPNLSINLDKLFDAFPIPISSAMSPFKIF